MAKPAHSPEDRLAEATGLAEAIDLHVVAATLVPLASPKPGAFFGSGKVDEIKAEVADGDIELIIVDHAISPVQ